MAETPSEWAARTRREQGLPEHLEDPEVLAELAAAVVAERQRAAEMDDPECE